MVRFGGTRAAWALALWLASGCDAARENPQLGSPGLEPPHEVDAGAPPPPAIPGGSSGNVDGSPQDPDPGMGPTSGTAGSGGSASTPPGSMGSAGNSAPVVDEDGGVAPGPGDALFRGLWVIEQPSHALYEATLYELEPSGDLATLDTYTLSVLEPDYVTGTVENADRSKKCSFGGGWRTLAARLLELDATCSDGTPRKVQLSFPKGDPSAGLLPNVVSVGGEMGWEHRDWPWSWRTCATRDDCPPF